MIGRPGVDVMATPVCDDHRIDTQLLGEFADRSPLGSLALVDLATGRFPLRQTGRRAMDQQKPAVIIKDEATGEQQPTAAVSASPTRVSPPTAAPPRLVIKQGELDRARHVRQPNVADPVLTP